MQRNYATCSHNFVSLLIKGMHKHCVRKEDHNYLKKPSNVGDHFCLCASAVVIFSSLQTPACSVLNTLMRIQIVFKPPISSVTCLIKKFVSDTNLFKEILFDRK